jgi:hypothetical protein
MKTIETQIDVDEQGVARLRVVTGLAPGKHDAVLIIEDEQHVQPAGTLPALPKFDIGPWPEGLRLSRADLYDERGR